MAGKTPFDTTRAAFYLVAGVIAVHCMVVLSGVVFCGFNPDGARCGDLRGALSELLTGALAAALAFAGGYSKRDR
jgi:hypothetical protein